MPSRPGSIVLIGMMGAGKSSVGRALQMRTSLPRFDLDDRIIDSSGLSIPEIFSQKGEPWFRDRESEALAALPLDPPSIVVTGGGIVLREENVQILKRLGTVVWLEADQEVLLERASRRGNRPLLQTENPAATLREILAARQPIYTRVADLRIDTTQRNHDEVTDMILAEIEKRAATG